MRIVGWFEVVVGVAILGLWTALLAAGQVPEIEAGQVDIWFHLAAEVLLAGLLIAGGTALLRRTARGPLLSGLALGALAYSAINSPGYYAGQGELAMVGLFAVVVLATAGSVVVLWRAGRPTDPDRAVAPAWRDQLTNSRGGAA
jgi:hypothetical protein